MFEPLPVPAEMAEWDQSAIHEIGIRGELLMENAGREALNVLRQACGPLSNKRVLVLAGPGNNGGDAFVVARHLHDLGANVLLLHSRAQSAYKGHAGYHLRLAKRIGTPIRRLTPSLFRRYHQKGSISLPNGISFSGSPEILIDGLLGTGFEGSLRADMLEIVQLANQMTTNAVVLALDIPSGLNGATGMPQPIAIRADLTATFGAVKLGLALPEAAEYTGLVAPCDIGIPNQCLQSAPPRHFRIAPEIFDIAPKANPNAHKGQNGSLLVVGGSRGLTGAPHLAALGALRAGCGLVTVAAPAALCRDIKLNHPEIMTLPLGQDCRWSSALAEELVTHLNNNPARYHALAVGPGLGRSDGARHFLSVIGRSLTLPTVYDADALFHLSNLHQTLPAQAVITPHPGEAARLLGCSTREIQADRITAARQLATLFHTVAVLKGAWSLVADPPGRIHLCDMAVPSLAVAGSGDVLTGLTGYLLAMGFSPLHAACLGVYWHASAGKHLDQLRHRGHLAGEIANALADARHQYNKEASC
ncbi:NAD(P)H-hydrate epimerase [Paucidesulfovibrio gracilis DSM 16080]|uniref:Bifunctional NAD(P)H-hydrate repair enzyme n=1 Tax=Paucidesulfovibrio gracilis DSM 16080 TaxID=1121449 RepID=A0A1T4WV20_9BACT|nr:NAD(P)H-hydrate dehydratase [Paucidesulfovibrio gracilis]SKA80725.1 NAD(P)H-hydrate epimerase [Paucidesulfovibrio gracilis DSM 16080]